MVPNIGAYWIGNYAVNKNMLSKFKYFEKHFHIKIWELGALNNSTKVAVYLLDNLMPRLFTKHWCPTIPLAIHCYKQWCMLTL